jgi:SAM-dependent methyltransferase
MKTFSNDEIHEIYNKHVKINYNNEYYNKYVPTPLHLNNKKWRWEGKDVPRIPALLEFKEYSEKYNFNFEKVLSFNGDEDPEYEYINAKQIINYEYYADTVNHDLHTLNLKEHDFDFIMINQTIEHLYNPVLCIENIYKHLRSGGIFYANVPANNIPHGVEHYYTGITPLGLALMTKSAGFEILEIGQWGNLDYLKHIFDKNNWGDYTYSNLPFYNDINCPLITWVLAKKL